MDILSRPPSLSKDWPEAPAARGKTYGVMDPVFKTEKLVVMSADTWVDYGTAFEKQRRELRDSLAAGQKLKVAYDTAVSELATLREKHQNLRAAEKRRRMSAAGFKGSI